MEMGSSTGSKWLLLLVLYFGIMTLIVTLVSTITPITTSTVTSGEQCSEPRTIWEQDNPEPVDITGYSSFVQSKFMSNLACGSSIGIFANDTCESISGCTWEIDVKWFAPDVETCTGDINYTHYGFNTTYVLLETFGIGHRFTVDDDNNFQSACIQDAVILDETLCNMLSCTWENRSGLSAIDLDEINTPKVSMIGKMWRNIKDMFLFKFDFGFTDASANYILNFIIFWLPLLALILAFVQFIPFLG